MKEKKRGGDRNARKGEFPECYGIPGRSRLPYLAGGCGEVQEAGTEEGARAFTRAEHGDCDNIHFVLHIVRHLYRVVHFVVHVKRSS